MAKLAVDRLVERDSRDAQCRTHEIPLGEPVEAASLPRIEGVDDQAYEPLARRYGHAAEEVLAIASESGELAQAILPAFPDLLAEAVYAARREQALTVADVLFRRTRLGVLAARDVMSDGVPQRVARAMAGECGWDAARVADEVTRFRQEAEAEGLEVVA
jgi:glycerol-3-phosphate dehydrogenase